MHWISWIILGAIAGFIGHKIVGENGHGFLANTAIGIVGALIGGEIMTMLGGREVNGLNLYSMAVAVGGSIVLLVVVHLLKQTQNRA
jgi:uncharacterized membrane protein YeaQ/YmgE (transglycosylase-associated protein family)